jgi:ribosomal protein S18 acetylase RimI-like enzyme
VRTTDSASRIVRADRHRLPVLASVLGRALADDPIFQWSLGGVASAQAVAASATAIYAPYADLGMVWEGGDAAGVAVWVPPEGAYLLATGDPAAASPPPEAPDETDRRQATWDWLESFVPEGVWYLEVLGVEPACQHRGVGTSLTRHGLERAYEDRVDAFLETSVASNVPYYQHLGFNVVDEGDIPAGGPHVWFMTCTP